MNPEDTTYLVMSQYEPVDNFLSFNAQTVKTMYPNCPASFYTYMSSMQRSVMRAKGNFETNITYTIVAEDEVYWDQADAFDDLLSQYSDNIRDYYDEDCLYNTQDNDDVSWGRWDYSDCINYVVSNVNYSVSNFMDGLNYLVDNCNTTKVSLNVKI